MDKDRQVRDHGSNHGNDATVSGHALDALLENWDPSLFSLAHQDPVQLQELDIVLGEDGVPIQAISRSTRSNMAMRPDQQPDLNDFNENGSLCQSVPAFDLNGTQTHPPDNQFPTFDNAQEQFDFDGYGEGSSFWAFACRNGVRNLQATEAPSVSETISSFPHNLATTSTPVAVTPPVTAVPAITPSSDQNTPAPAIPSSSNSPSSSGDLSGTVGLLPSTYLSRNASSVDSTAQGSLQVVSHVDTLTVDQSNVAGSAIPHQHTDEDENLHIPNTTSNHSLNALQSAQSTTWSDNPLGPADPFACLASYPYHGRAIAQDVSSTCSQRSTPDHAHEDEGGLNGGTTLNEQDDDAERWDTGKSSSFVQLFLPEDRNNNTGGDGSAEAASLGSFMQGAPVSSRKANPLQAEGFLVTRTCRISLSCNRGASDFAGDELRAQAGLFASYSLAHNRIDESLLLPSSSGSTGLTRGLSGSTLDEAPVLSTTLPAPEVGSNVSSPDIPLANAVVPPCVHGANISRTGSLVTRAPSNKSSKASGKKPKPLLYDPLDIVPVDGAPLVERIRKNPIKKVDLPLYRGYPFYPDAPIPHRVITVKRSDVKRVSTPATSETQPEEHESPQAGSIGETAVHNTNDTPVSPSVVPGDVSPSTACNVPPPPAPTASTSSVSDANAVPIPAVTVEHPLQSLQSMAQQQLIQEENAAVQRLLNVRAELDLRRRSGVQQSAPLS
ncbi:hypothetical protein BC629DRAFT_1446783 [Irpex lacteus]|nr:hypothetical protein BC629DRAFT_1446783 [Irpex lacteus]